MTRLPAATYRLQLRSGMTFEAAAALAPYLARFGVSHLYLSPIFDAASGSTHGYDVTDCNTLDPALGGETGFAFLCDVLRRHDLQLIVDFVPNHMAATSENGWWRDVLEWGPASHYAHHFDIDWSAPKLLLPVLGTSYGQALAESALALEFEPQSGALVVAYGRQRLPLFPPSYADILNRAHDDPCAELARLFSVAEPRGAVDLKLSLAQLAKREEVVDRLSRICTETSADVAQLHDLLERQVWRLTHGRLGREELTYRRFFEITGLVGLKVERPVVFDDVHRKVLALVRSGQICGIRLDHIDGLADPTVYLERLRSELPHGKHIYVVVEKILGPGEELRSDWPIHGTTGYEFANALTGLFVNSERENDLTQAYEHFRGGKVDYHVQAAEAKRQILGTNLAAELTRLVHAASNLAVADITTRDLGPDTLRNAIIELATAMSVYRTYIGDAGAQPADRAVIGMALDRARAARRVDNPDALDFLARVLLIDLPDAGMRRNTLAFTQLFQQTTGPTMAKAIEDTAFYRYNRLIALNEVGGEPAHFGVSPQMFHEAMEVRRESQPYGLSTTSTHDTKRGEDTRARICVLSEIPVQWSTNVEHWRQINQHLTTLSESDAFPDAETEWLFYQSLLGAWPMETSVLDDSALGALADRMTAFMIKAAREAKLHTSWAIEDRAYEAAIEHFVRGALDAGRSGAFLEDFARTITPIVVAGALNSLSQTLIKITAPGVPDTYQGAELWDLSLVDPDNRRPIDFSSRARLLAASETSTVEELLDAWRGGLPKLHMTAKAQALRRLMPNVFAAGAYQPLEIKGSLARHALAFARVSDQVSAVVIAPRLCHELLAGSDTPQVPPERWRDTHVLMKDTLSECNWMSALVTDHRETAGDTIELSSALARFPVGLFVSEAK
jgi:(1->4)-alpha-D-glucan 1-alpha-D-glucosylmutase